MGEESLGDQILGLYVVVVNRSLCWMCRMNGQLVGVGVRSLLIPKECYKVWFEDYELLVDPQIIVFICRHESATQLWNSCTSRTTFWLNHSSMDSLHIPWLSCPFYAVLSMFIWLASLAPEIIEASFVCWWLWAKFFYSQQVEEKSYFFLKSVSDIFVVQKRKEEIWDSPFQSNFLTKVSGYLSQCSVWLDV